MSASDDQCSKDTHEVCDPLENYPTGFQDRLLSSDVLKWYCPWGYTEWSSEECGNSGGTYVVWEGFDVRCHDKFSSLPCQICTNCTECAAYISDSQCGPGKGNMDCNMVDPVIVCAAVGVFVMIAIIIAIGLGVPNLLWRRLRPLFGHPPTPSPSSYPSFLRQNSLYDLPPSYSNVLPTVSSRILPPSYSSNEVLHYNPKELGLHTNPSEGELQIRARETDPDYEFREDLEDDFEEDFEEDFEVDVKEQSSSDQE